MSVQVTLLPADVRILIYKELPLHVPLTGASSKLEWGSRNSRCSSNIELRCINTCLIGQDGPEIAANSASVPVLTMIWLVCQHRHWGKIFVLYKARLSSRTSLTHALDHLTVLLTCVFQGQLKRFIPHLYTVQRSQRQILTNITCSARLHGVHVQTLSWTGQNNTSQAT